MDCVSAAMNTLFPEAADNKTIDKLLAEGHKVEANLLRRVNLMRTRVDVGGHPIELILPIARELRVADEDALHRCRVGAPLVLVGGD